MDKREVPLELAEAHALQIHTEREQRMQSEVARAEADLRAARAELQLQQARRQGLIATLAKKYGEPGMGLTLDAAGAKAVLTPLPQATPAEA